MVNKWICRNPISIQERKKIEEGIKMQMTYREIGEFVGRPKTTVIRESKRLGNVDKYDAEKAQNDFELKQKNCGYKKK